MARRAVMLQMMREMTPSMSSSDGASLKVEEITYRGDVPISPVKETAKSAFVHCSCKTNSM